MEGKALMTKWLISVPQVWRRNHEVEADTEYDAITAILDGESEPVGDVMFSSVMEPDQADFIVLNTD